ncbi:MAG: 50S ribosomal protein L35 [Chloroflexi bacterium]|nr:50S ribosomal protein L35 [Chloroflexota bacterium]
MPKLKTHKGAASRFRVTGGGKLVRMKIGASHFRRRKTKRTKRLYSDTVPTSSRDVTRIRRLISYAGK